MLVKIPVYVDQKTAQQDIVINEYALRKSIEWTLKRYNIEPDIFHIRYSDIGSKIILDLAKQLHKKVVFTITPDPHRNMEQRFAHQSLNAIQQQELQESLDRVNEEYSDCRQTVSELGPETVRHGFVWLFLRKSTE